MTPSQPVSLSLRGATLMPATGPYSPMVLDTTEGPIEARFYQPEQPSVPSTAILWLGDVTGGFDSPAGGAYDRLAERFQALGVASLRLQYRNPLDHATSGLDALVGAFLLVNQGFERFVAVGHGLGALGAVQVGLSFPAAAGVAAIAPHQTAIDGIERLSPKPLLLMHGTADIQVRTQVSREILAKAREPKRIYYYQGADHQLSQAVEPASADLFEWISETLDLGKAKS
jgi:hypothetical protein